MDAIHREVLLDSHVACRIGRAVLCDNGELVGFGRAGGVFACAAFAHDGLVNARILLDGLDAHGKGVALIGQV